MIHKRITQPKHPILEQVSGTTELRDCAQLAFWPDTTFRCFHLFETRLNGLAVSCARGLLQRIIYTTQRGHLCLDQVVGATSRGLSKSKTFI